MPDHPAEHGVLMRAAIHPGAAFAHDAYGHALGGLRTPWVDVPDANYLPRISPLNPLRAGMRRFPEEKIVQHYGRRANCLKLVNRKIDEMVKHRWVRPGHAGLIRRSAWA